MSGWLVIAGLGPGADGLVTPEVRAALAEATDVVGYIPYVARVAPRPGLTLHPSDNRVEIDRSRHALEMAADGRRVVVVSSGDPGVFARGAEEADALRDAAPDDTIRDHASSIAAIADQIARVNRSLLEDLRPVSIGQLPLAAVLAEYVDDMGRRFPRTDIRLSLAPDLPEPDESVALTLFRILQ